MSVIGALHTDLVFSRRVKILAEWFSLMLPKGVRVLDVGCGDGSVSSLIQSKRPDVDIRGVEVLPREQAHIPVEIFDGTHIPYGNSSFDLVLFSDVLHHTIDPDMVLREAHRVSAKYVLIKDHYRNGIGAGPRLRLMDWVGNARFGVALPYNYWSRSQWAESWKRIGLCPEKVVTKLSLYPGLANWIFGAQLHFIALLKKCNPTV